MKATWAYCAVGLGLISVLTVANVHGLSSTSAGVEVANATVAVSMVLAEDEVSYVGTKKCKMCHSKQNKSWKKTKHANAMKLLEAGEAAEVKTKHGLDPGKDYTKDAACLPCHTVGYGKTGGYQVPDPEDKKSVKKAKYLSGVGCEMCHGPGSAYAAHHKELLTSGAQYTSEEMYAKGLMKVDENTCKACHNEENPTADENTTFDYEARLKDGVHEHFDLKQKKE